MYSFRTANLHCELKLRNSLYDVQSFIVLCSVQVYMYHVYSTIPSIKGRTKEKIMRTIFRTLSFSVQSIPGI
jgi:hypothetical protein